ncbi:uncharacterized protein METZ01_LOCUS424076, partial [marine metagenome]
FYYLLNFFRLLFGVGQSIFFAFSKLILNMFCKIECKNTQL